MSKTYEFKAITGASDGSVILRSSHNQDVENNYHTMLQAIRQKYPTARPIDDFRTFEGDAISQFAIASDNTIKNNQFIVV